MKVESESRECTCTPLHLPAGAHAPVSTATEALYLNLYGRLLSPLGRNALYCALRFGLDIKRIFFNATFSPGKIIWNQYLRKDTLMFRENKQQCILTHDEIETVIRAIYTK